VLKNWENNETQDVVTSDGVNGYNILILEVVRPFEVGRPRGACGVFSNF
jgi:hypothetical protein